MPNSGNNTKLYFVTTIFVCGFLLIGTAFIVWALLVRPLNITDDDKYYVSAMDMKILNETLGPAVVQISDDAPLQAQPITVESLRQDIAQYPDCMAAFNKADNWQKLTSNLQKLQKKVVLESHKLQQGSRLKFRYTLDTHRWADYACAELGKIESNTGLAIKPFHLNYALYQLAKIESDVFVPGNVYWCEKKTNRIRDNCKLPGWSLEFNNTLLAVKNPWSGLKGCLLLRDTKGAAPQYYFLAGRKANAQITQRINEICANAISDSSTPAIAIKEQPSTPKSFDDVSWLLPTDYSDILQPMQGLRLAQPLRQETEDGEVIDLLENNTVEFNGKDRQIGLHTELTIQPKAQKLARQIAMCYTGHLEVCNGLGIGNAIQSDKFYEDAVVRKAGIVILDTPTGEIEVLASANSQCFTKDHEGVKRDKDCPIPSYMTRWNKDALRNHAYFDEAPPASTVKPIMSVAFLQDSANIDYKSLGRELAHSDSEAFLRRMFCLAPANARVDCPLAQKIQQTAIALGWDSNCTSMNSEDSQTYGCGQIDSLWGKSTTVELGDVNQGVVQNNPGLYGWFMVKPAAETTVLRADFRFTVDKQRSTNGKEWYSQQTASVRDLSNDGLGQGESLVRPIGVAGMLANLALAEKKQAQQPLPHLIRRMFDVNGKELELLKATKPDMIPVTIPPEIAKQVLMMMQGNHKGTKADHGTGYTACVAVIGASACNQLTSVAGKTGTPTIKDAQNTQANLERNGGCKKECYRPYKWYTAAYKSNPRLSYYDKVMVVLIERNWRKEGQLTGDEYNHAAEMAFRLMKGLGVVH